MSSSSFPSSSPSPPHSSQDDQVASLKRRLNTAQNSLDALTGQKKKKPVTTTYLGRGIRRLVALHDSLFELIDEADRRNEDSSDPADPEEKIVRDRLFAGYWLLHHQVPELRKLIEDPNASPEALDQFLAALQKGANDARADDLRRIMTELAGWLNQDFSPPQAFSIRDRQNRGLQNDITGRLLCPVDVDWQNESVCAQIRNGSLSIADNYFLRCLYPRSTGDPTELDRNFLQSALLVKAYCCIFTSPSSIEEFDQDSENGPTRKKLKGSGRKKATKQNVAKILRMDSRVTPRSIAYVATLLVFNLTDAAQWVEVYNGFSFSGFYNFVVDYFRDVSTPESKAHVDSLLCWWNQHVFPDRAATVTNAQASRNKLAAQRARLQAIRADRDPLSDLSLNPAA